LRLSRTRKHNGVKLLAAACLAISANTSAVHINPDGRGQVLLYPYFTVRADGAAPDEYYDSYVAIVNPTQTTKAIKVRALEARKGESVFEFNLFLSPNDVWAGAITRSTGSARWLFNDSSCVQTKRPFTDPALREFRTPKSGVADEARDGWLEVTEMGVVTDVAWTAWIKQGKNVVPANCAAIAQLDGTMSRGLAPPTGGLFGRGALVNVTAGSDFSYDAVALDDWSATEQYTASDSEFPKLNGMGGEEGLPSKSTSLVLHEGKVIIDDWGTGPTAAANAVSAAMMRYTIKNEFSSLRGTASSTDWVITFPTRSLHTTAAGLRAAPFARVCTRQFIDPCGAQPIKIADKELTLWNREGLGAAPLPGIVCPLLPPIENFSPICELNAAGIVTFDSKGLLGSLKPYYRNPQSSLVDQRGVPTAGPEGNETGWMSVNFNDSDDLLIAPSGRKYFGLPAIGFMVEDYLNVAARPITDPRGRVSTYGGLHQHKYSRKIEDR
jgi:hypothetical protein